MNHNNKNNLPIVIVGYRGKMTDIVTKLQVPVNILHLLHTI